MNTAFNFQNQSLWEKFTSLKETADVKRKDALKRRITHQPRATDLEFLLGAFMEMYELHLHGIIHKLIAKGYAVDASSGFGGKNSEFQVLTGEFSIDFVTKNKLEKMGVKFREFNGMKSLVFWPQKATIDDIKKDWTKVVNALPDKGKLVFPSSSAEAVSFRRRYVPKDSNLQKERLFEKLKFSIQQGVYFETKKRQKESPRPNKIEIILGFFIEEIEPQVRQAVINMNKKGYSTDRSGFSDNPCEQMVEGDFRVGEETVKMLEDVGVQLETNPSGYTRLKFSPLEADIPKIKKQWDKIASLLPNKDQTASFSMTRKAREFRLAYQ